jgi:hypothetical protein
MKRFIAEFLKFKRDRRAFRALPQEQRASTARTIFRAWRDRVNARAVKRERSRAPK